MTGSYWLAALAVCVVGSGVRAEDAYSVKPRENAAGDVIAVERTDTVKEITKIVDAAGKVIKNQSESDTCTFVYKYKETILEQKTSERPTRLSRHYEKAEETEDGRTTLWPYQGKIVLIEKKGEHYDFRVEGGNGLSSEDAVTLDAEFNSNIVWTGDQTHLTRLFLPAKPIRLNEVWKADTDPLVKKVTQSDSIGINPLKAKGTAVLTKTYKMGDKQYGVLHCEVEAPMEWLEYDGVKADLDDGAKWTFRSDIDACIDGQAKGGVIKASYVIKVNGTYSDFRDAETDGQTAFSREYSTTITRHEWVEK